MLFDEKKIGDQNKIRWNEKVVITQKSNHLQDFSISIGNVGCKKIKNTGVKFLSMQQKNSIRRNCKN